MSSEALQSSERQEKPLEMISILKDVIVALEEKNSDLTEKPAVARKDTNGQKDGGSLSVGNSIL